MKYRFDLKRLSDSKITHTQESDDPNYAMKIPNGWGYIHAGWYTEDQALKLGLKLEDALETKVVVDNEYQDENLETIQETHTEYWYNKNYEIKDTNLDEDETYQKQLALAEKLKLGKKSRLCSDDVYDLIAGWNLSRELTTEQISQMMALFSDTVASLQAKRPDLAKALISTIEVDGTLVTQEMKDDVLTIFEKYGF